MSKKLMAMLLCAILVVTLLPVTAMADGTTTSVWIWGEELTSETPYYHNGEDGTQGTVDATPTDANAYFDADSGVLTLDGLNVAGSTANRTGYAYIYAIHANGDLTIDLDGDSEISTAAATGEKENRALDVLGSLTLRGDGKLTSTAGSATREYAKSYGVKVGDTLSIEGGSLEGTGAATPDSDYGYSVGVYASELVVSDGSLTGTGGAITVNKEAYSIGVDAWTDLTVSGGTLKGNGGAATGDYASSSGVCVGGTLSIEGGTIIATGGVTNGGNNGSYSQGVEVHGGLNVTGGKLTAEGGHATLQPDGKAYPISYGIYAEADILSFSGGTVDATGGEADDQSYGILNAGVYDYSDDYDGVYVSGGAIAVSGTAIVSATGGEAWDSFGLWCRDDGLSVSGGKLTAEGGTAEEYSFGIYAMEGDEEINGKEVTAVGGEADIESFGVYAEDGKSAIRVFGGKFTAKSENATKTSALNKALVLGSGVTAKGSTSSDGSEPLNYVEADNGTYKWVSVTERPAMPSDDDDYSPSPVTVYNDPSVPNATVWLTGNGLAANDLLITRRDPSGSAYQALLNLAESGDVFATYDISLRSGSKNYGSAMRLTFDLNSKYAGQDFTLVHQKASGAYEYFYDTADAAGDLTFGPLYELSPFMLVEGTLSPTAEGAETNPNTGVSAAPALLLGLALLAGVGLAVSTGRIRGKK